MNDQPFEIFGGVHIFSLLIIVLMTVWLSLVYKDRTDGQKSGMAKILAYILIAHILSSPIKDLFILENPYSWKEVLPLHMCDLSEIFLAWFLLGGPKLLYKCAFFWGIGGASMALITPDVYFYDLEYLYFFIGHGAIILTIIYATVVLGNRPYFKDILTVSAITIFILLPMIYVINLILGEPANYWYLLTKPIGANIMDLFPEPPLHIFYTIPIATLVFFLIYLPYAIKDRLNR